MKKVSLDFEFLCDEIFAQGLKHWWIAERAGLHRTTLRRWTSGKVRRVRLEGLLRVAAILELPVEALMDG